MRSLERELRVTLLDRKRSGATMSAGGNELLPHIMGVLDTVDRLPVATDHQVQSARIVRIGTVNAATSPLLAPALTTFGREHAAT